jgi:predicted ATPase
VAELLSSAPGLKVLVSSRAVLHLYGEYEFGVPPLSLPDLSHVPPLEGLTQYEAVRLFIDRAVAVKPDFAVTNANAPAVAEICHRLDGLPLAIELAAARVKLFSPEVLLKRLERCLPLLTSGMRGLPARQQTLRNTIDWSYQLLDAGEQMLFRRLAVFVGGCTLEAAEAVCNATDERSSDRERSASLDMLDKLIALVDKSVLRQEIGADGEPRFMMLETIREYAWEQMDKSEETDTIRRRHALFFLRLVETAEPQLQTAEQIVWLDRLEAEHNNLGAALTWSLSTVGNVEIGLRFAAALWRFWSLRNHLSEGQAWCAAVLAQPDASTPTRLRARVLNQAAYLAGTDYELAELNDSALARRFHEESLAICQALDDRHGTAYALYGLGQVTAGDGNLAEATTLYQQSLTLCQAQGDLWGSARALHALGNLAVHQGNGSQAAALLGESLAVWRTVGDTSCIAMVLHSLGSMAWLQGDNDQAAAWLHESLTLSRALRSKGDITRTLHRLGDIEREQGHIEQAMALLEESLVLAQELGDTSEVAWILDGLGDVALQQDDPARAAARYQESLRLCRELDHTFGIVIALYCLGRAAMQQGDYVQAVTMLEESLTLVRPLGIKMHITAVLRLLGRAALFQGDAAQAAVRYQESIRLAQEMGQQSIIIQCLEGLAEVATVWGRADRAAHLFGATEARREALNSPLSHAERSTYEQAVAAVRAQLGDAACAVAWAEGRAMPLEQVIVEALGIANAVQADAP